MFASHALGVTRYGTEAVHGNITIVPDITMVNDTHAEWGSVYPPVLVSGTNVPISCGITVTKGQSGRYVDAQFWYWELWIDGELLDWECYNPDYPLVLGVPAGGMMAMGSPGPIEPPPASVIVPQRYLPPDMRFASNHYDDGTTHTAELRTWVKLYETVNGQRACTGEAPANVSIEFKTYNKLLAWRTTKRITGQDWGPAEQGYIDGTVGAGKTHFQSAKYASVQASMDVGIPEMRTGLYNSTGVFVNTHGTQVLLYKTDGYPGMPPNYPSSGPNSALAWVDIMELTKLDAHRRPPHSWVLLYACQTLLSFDPSSAFHLRSVDGCLLGFRRVIMPKVLDAANSTPGNPAYVSLAEHPTRLFDLLEDGHAAADALTRTQNDEDGFMPQHSPTGDPDPNDWVSEPMLLRGDGLTTWTSVYLSAAERFAYEDEGRFTSWYIVYENGPLW